jgi:hypothetical protein
MQKEITVGERKFVVREMLAIEFDKIMEEIKDIVDDSIRSKESFKKQIMITASLSEKEFSELTIKERTSIGVVMNQLNDISDFLPKGLEKKN